jgi:hypothetical protein
MNQRKWIARNVALTGCVGILATMVACSDDSTTPAAPVDGSAQDAAVQDSAVAESATADANPGNDVAAQDVAALDGSSTDSNAVMDEGIPGDGGAADTAAADTGTTDTGMADGGAVDTGVVDTSVADTSAVDTGVHDTSVGDTSLLDTGVHDTSVGDTSVGDTSVGDTSVGDTSVDDTSVGDTGAGDVASGDSAAQPPPPLNMCGVMDSFFNGQRLGANGWMDVIANGPSSGPAQSNEGFTFVLYNDCAVSWIYNAVNDNVGWSNDVINFEQDFFGCPPDAGTSLRPFALVPAEVYGQTLSTATLQDLGDWFVESIDWAVTNQSVSANPSAHLTGAQIDAIEAEIAYQETLYPKIINSPAFTNTACASDAGAD